MEKNEVKKDIISTPYGDIPIKTSLKGSTELIVFLSGAIQRTKKSPPIFQRETWLSTLPFSAIAIPDDTLLLNDSIELGWYLGDGKGQILKKLITSLYHFFKENEFSFHNVIFYGSSGGGFAASLLASYFRGARAIMINPQTDISRYHRPVYDKFITVSQYSKHYTHSLMEVFSRKSFIPNIQYLQNTQDTFHYREHYLPLMQWFSKTNLSINNNSGLISFIEYSMKGGHAGLHNAEESYAFITQYITDNHLAKPSGAHKLMPIATQFITLETFTETVELQINTTKEKSKLIMYYDDPLDDENIESLISLGWIQSKNVQIFKYIDLPRKNIIKKINMKSLSKLPYVKIRNWFSGCDIDISVNYH